MKSNFNNHADNEILKFLSANGYTGFNDLPLLGTANWEIFKRGFATNNCQCNDRPPQFMIERHKGEFVSGDTNHKFDYYEIHVVGATNLEQENEVWLRTYLTVNKEQLMAKLDEIEKRLTAMWDAFNTQV